MPEERSEVGGQRSEENAPPNPEPESKIQNPESKIDSSDPQTAREALALSRGELKTRIVSRAPVANALRSIQSTLRHLAWQANAVADGDLDREIYGLGSLGEAFNRMAQRLRESRDAITAKNAELPASSRR